MRHLLDVSCNRWRRRLPRRWEMQLRASVCATTWWGSTRSQRRNPSVASTSCCSVATKTNSAQQSNGSWNTVWITVWPPWAPSFCCTYWIRRSTARRHYNSSSTSSTQTKYWHTRHCTDSDRFIRCMDPQLWRIGGWTIWPLSSFLPLSAPQWRIQHFITRLSRWSTWSANNSQSTIRICWSLWPA